MKIEISAELFSRLQKLAIPFVDTPESVIERAISSLEKQSTQPEVASNPPRSKPSKNNFEYTAFDELPSVKHTRPLKVVIDSLECLENTWSAVNHWVHTRAASIVGVEELLDLTKANIKQGVIEEKGFDYLPKIGCSIQRSDAVTTLRQICHLAEALDLQASILFEWKTHDEALYPGKSGTLTLKPLSGGI